MPTLWCPWDRTPGSDKFKLKEVTTHDNEVALGDDAEALETLKSFVQQYADAINQQVDGGLQLYRLAVNSNLPLPEAPAGDSTMSGGSN
jgi:hypothetical protein